MTIGARFNIYNRLLFVVLDSVVDTGLINYRRAVAIVIRQSSEYKNVPQS